MASPEPIEQFLNSRFRTALAGQSLGATDPLFSSGLIDSFGVLELVAFLEDTFHITIDTGRHDLAEFDTIEKIRSLVQRLREGG